MNNHIDELIKKYKAMPGSEACLVVADQLEELGDPNSEIVRDSLLADTDFEENGAGSSFWDGFGDGCGSGFGDRLGRGFGDGCGGGNGRGYGNGYGSSGNGDGSGSGCGNSSGPGSGRESDVVWEDSQ